MLDDSQGPNKNTPASSQSPTCALNLGSTGIRTAAAEEAAHALAEAAKWNPEASRRNRLATNPRRKLLVQPR